MAKPAKKPTNKSTAEYVFGWLGRQVGHVKKSVKTDVKKPAPASKPTPKPAQPAQPQVIYRDGKVEEVDHPSEPGVKLRRTVIDEVIVDPNRQIK